MKKFNLLTAVILGVVLIYSANNFAQKKDKGCCTDSSDCKMEKMDHSKMDSTNMKGKMDHSKMGHSKMDHSMMKGKMDHSKKENCCNDSAKCEMGNMDKSEMDHSKMGHSKMDHSMMKGDMKMGEMKAKKVENTMTAWNAVCPVRGEEIDPEANKVEYNGKVYGFCCNGCDSKFMNDPVKYGKNLSEDGKEFIGTK